jgi:multidrug efflux pump subunit AcrB
MMTSFAFIAGLYPLVVGTGAAMLSRRTGVGTAVIGGMIDGIRGRRGS